jgi:hypothetical protein
MSAQLTFNDRTYIRQHDLEALPWLPHRVAIDELKQYGMVNLRHVKKPKVKPWLRRGWYKFIGNDGRLYVLEISENTLRGQGPSGWLYRPHVRCPAFGRRRRKGGAS